MSTLKAKIRHEVSKAIPPTLFFFVILHIVALCRALMVRGTGISLPVSASVLIADLLPFINRFPEKPLIWNVVWKTFMYALVALAVHYPERLFEFWKHASGLIEANSRLRPDFLAEQNRPVDG
ncbi:hypothetical protein [Paraburkholderia sp. HP33-1]|uniref:hypothetical protein n=1 Tax=Paraburkholderia sp. HP33-1 TaxID=2883243 RepID=UPI003FA3BDA5